ncbi:uncharacterized protein LOC135098775 [Scylla paramamosain]|uniref:uncharacterized protein LOC135098775 n=1 Tax=Scylla paramamosain TaxID=85552 RepID=UPI0030829710
MSTTQRRRARRRALAEALKASAESEAAAKPEETRVSSENKATAAAATEIKLSASQKRRTRRRALAEALKASAEGEAAAKPEETRAAAENEASAARMKSVARPPCAEKTSRADCTKRSRTPDRMPIWASPSARASENDGGPLVTEATATPATHGGTSATRRRRARRKALASWTKSEARLVATTFTCWSVIATSDTQTMTLQQVKVAAHRWRKTQPPTLVLC